MSFRYVTVCLAALVSCAAAEPLPELKWVSGPEVVPVMKDAAHPNVSIKDPTVVRVDGRWHLFATTADAKSWQMVYLSFADWKDAATAKPYFMDQTPGLAGYHCAPQVFFFEPHKKWYLIFQSQQPQFCTTETIGDPKSWSKPQDFFATKPASAPKLWIDYWVICDATHAYLFFTGDDGKFYRSRTTLEQFPAGMSEPVIAMEDPNRFNLFEGGATYKIKGTDQYLTLIEAFGPTGDRYYRSFIADKLDGEWKPLAATWDKPFAGMSNVRFADGVTPWTKDISHGELIRDGYDQTLTIDPQNLQLLFQGRPPTEEKLDYQVLPYRLGLLKLDR